MLLNELFRINEAGLVADAVNFDMMADEEKNLHLCQGFIFNYDHGKPRESTVGVLDALRRSYHSRNEPNVHLLVQDYGKGKSHFALVIANFFKQPYENPEVQGILQQVELATAATSSAVLENFKAYKQRSKKHLVICLSGERGDLKQLFLRSLRQALEAEGITNSIAQRVCAEPIRYLEGLNLQQLAIAEAYLESIGNPNGDVQALIQLLREDNYHIIPTVIDISRELTGGYPIDFEADLNLEDILDDLIKMLCSGENRRFDGILILLDELNAYLQNWASNPAAAGGLALQNITNVCELHKGRIALMSLTQIRPSNAASMPLHSQEIKSYQKLTSRLELSPSTYEPVSSLELVLSKLIICQSNTLWQQFRARWDTTLLAESRDAYSKRIKTYRERNWPFQEFHRHLALNCFPLHPITAYLLCNLDFTQGRTAIQFIKEDIKNFILNEPIEVVERLNYVYPVRLVDAFIDKLSNHSVYADYKKAYDSVIASADAEEIIVLKALFLFYATSDKLTKLDSEKHEDILSVLTGLSTFKLKTNLDKLYQTRNVIYPTGNNTYSFYSGFNIVDLERKIEAEIAVDELKGNYASINYILSHCRADIEPYFKSNTVCATHFVYENKLISEDWKFEYYICTPGELEKALFSDQTLKKTHHKGIIAYVIAETDEELQNCRDDINNLLSSSPIHSQVVVAISRQGTTDIARLLVKISKLKNKTSDEKRDLGPALLQLLQQLEPEVSRRLKEIFGACTYHCSVIEKLAAADRNNPQRLVSALLQELYSFVPPVEGEDRLKKAAGTKIISFISKQLFADNLTPQGLPDNSYSNVLDSMFVTRWGLLLKSSQKYSVTVPTHEKVRAAWEKISEMTDLGGMPEKAVDIAKIWERLSKPPYGYNELIFTILFTGWLAYHRTEVYLRGGFGIPQRRKDEVNVQIKPIREWANTNILDKPKDFVNVWIVEGKPRLIRRQPSRCPEIPQSVNYEQGQQYVQEIEAFLESGAPDPLKVSEIKKKREQLTTGIKQIADWFKPTEEAERLPQQVLEDLLPIYSSLLQELPSLVVKDGVINVCPTQQQCDRQVQALQAVRQKIEEMVTRHSQRSESLTTEKECGAYEVETQQTIEQLRQIPIPPHLIETLQNSLQAASRRLDALREQVKANETTAQIQQLFNGLGSNATQDDYLRIRSELEIIVQDVPAAKSETLYRQTIQKIEQQQDALNSLIKLWQAQCDEIISRYQAIQVKEQIISQKNRFTEPASQKLINDLLAELNVKATELGSQEEVEENFKNTLQEAQQKLQRIRDLISLPDALQVYHDLAQHNLPFISKVGFTETYQNQLEKLQSQGRTVISQKILDICNAQLERLENYEQVKSSLQTIQSMLSSSQDFANVKSTIEEALQRLTNQFKELQKRQEDKQTIQSIRQRSAPVNTIHLCEKITKEIEDLRIALNYPDELTAEIAQLLERYRKQAVDYRQNLEDLRNRLPKVENLKQIEAIQTEYAKLDLVFKDSTDYFAYQQLQEQIRCLKEDIERLSSLEHRQQDSSIVCNEVLKIIEVEQANFHDLGRFQPKLSKLKEDLHDRLEEIRERQQQAAKAWLEALENQAALLKQLTENTKRYEVANKLIKQIHTQKQHTELSSEQQQVVQSILDKCIKILHQEQETQIVDLFQQLSREHRINLYQRLSTYLQNSTEEFDG